MLLCELKILRELDGSPASDAVAGLARDWAAGWNGEATVKTRVEKVDTKIIEILKEILSAYPVTTSASLAHDAIKKLIPDEAAGRNAAKSLKIFEKIIIETQANYLLKVQALKDHGFKERLLRVQPSAGTVEDWIKLRNINLTRQLDKPMHGVTDQPNIKVSINKAFKERADEIIKAVTTNGGTQGIVDRAGAALEKDLKIANPDQDKAANLTLENVNSFIGFCRAMLENLYAVTRQLESFLVTDES